MQSYYMLWKVETDNLSLSDLLQLRRGYTNKTSTKSFARSARSLIQSNARRWPKLNTMAVKIIPSATIFVALLSVFATTLEQTSAFSTSSNHGRTNSLLSSSSSLRYEYQQRIGTVPVKQNCRAGDSHLFADASDTAVKAEENKKTRLMASQLIMQKQLLNFWLDYGNWLQRETIWSEV